MKLMKCFRQLLFLKACFMKRKISYINQGRYGRVIYSDKVSNLDFYFEFGGGNCVAMINIPAPADWEKETGRNISERDEINRFIAEQAIHDQVPGGYYKIHEDYIGLYSRK